MNLLNFKNSSKPFLRCEYCDQLFKYKSKLLRHHLVHTKIRQFNCTYCTASFSLKHNLQVHTRIHQGIKPYNCPIAGCGKSFTQSNNLTVHLRIHRIVSHESVKKIFKLDYENPTQADIN